MSINNIIPSAQVSFVGEFLGWVAEDADPNTFVQKLVAQVTQRIALPIFALIDATYHLSCAFLKLPFVAFKISVASLLGFSNQIPDSLGPSDWMEHMKKVAAAVIAIVSSVSLGLISQDAEVSLLVKLGLPYTWLNQDQYNLLPPDQRAHARVRHHRAVTPASTGAPGPVGNREQIAISAS